MLYTFSVSKIPGSFVFLRCEFHFYWTTYLPGQSAFLIFIHSLASFSHVLFFGLFFPTTLEGQAHVLSGSINNGILELSIYLAAQALETDLSSVVVRMSTKQRNICMLKIWK